MFPHQSLHLALRQGAWLLALSSLGACATAETTRSGFLSDYSRLETRTDSVRAQVARYRDDALIETIDTVWIEPTVIAGDIPEALTDEERELVTREIDRRLCFALSSRFAIASQPDPAAGRLRAAASRVEPTNPVGSGAAAVAKFFIPGPLGLRVPGSTGGLAAEAELLAPDGRQAAAVVWAREAQVLGTESPSLSRVGDAHQLTGAFAQAVSDAVAPEDRQRPDNTDGDPCERFGPRIRPEGFISRFITNLYSPELSGAQPEPSPEPSQEADLNPR